MKERLVRLDFLKAFAIFLVVLGHCIQEGYTSKFGMESEAFYLDPVFRFIYGAHLPLFMTISGYFYDTLKKKTTREVISSRIIRLLLPITSWHIIWMFIDGFSNNGLGYTPWTFIRGYLTHYWFLWAVLLCSLVFFVIYKFLSDRLGWYIFFTIVALIIPNILNFDRYVWLFPFFFMGYFLKKYSIQLESNVSKCVIIIGSLLLLMLYLTLSSHMLPENYIYKTGSCIIRDGRFSLYQLELDMFRYFIGFVGVLFYWGISLLLKKVYFSHCFSAIGSRTLGIYIIHMFFQPLISEYILPFNYLWSIVYSVVFISLSYVIILLIEKSKLLSFLLLGKQMQVSRA